MLTITSSLLTISAFGQSSAKSLYHFTGRSAGSSHQNLGLHVIVDESLALTDRSGLTRDLIVAGDPCRLHLFYVLSLDWGIAGLCVGFFDSKDPHVIKAARRALGCSFTGGDL
jgi:hypothetical protein